MKQKFLSMLALLLMAATGAWAQWTGGTHTATANENLNAINVSDDATLTINQGVTVTVSGGIVVADGKTLTVTGGGTLVATGANGAKGDTGQTGNAGGTAIAGNVIINGVGLTVTATGGQGGQGGQGGYAFAGTLTVYGGNVNAYGGQKGPGGPAGDGGPGGTGFDGGENGDLGESGEMTGEDGVDGVAYANNVTFETTTYTMTNGTDNITEATSKQTVIITSPDVVPGYAVTLADGTEDAGNWSISDGTNSAKGNVGLTGLNGNETVTITYSGSKRVKSVTAVKKAAAPRTLAEATAEDIGKVVGADGKIYANVAAAQAASTTACAIIAYVGSETGEASPYNHGLAIAMKDAAAGGDVMWSSSNKNESLTNLSNHGPAVTTPQSGLSNSQTSGFDNESNYPAFYAALHNTITTSDGISAAAPASDTSGWFLPSLYQWNKIVQGLSGQSADLSGDMNDNYKASSLNTKIEAAGGTGLTSYWSSTESSTKHAWHFNAPSGNVGVDNKSLNYNVRSAFAF